MLPWPLKHPILFEINARVWLRELSRSHGRPVTLADVPDEELDGWAAHGYNHVWLMGVWETGEVGHQIALTHPDLQAVYRKALADFTADDVIGSPYAVTEYRVARQLGGPDALAALRERLAKRGMGLILDFVSNHTAKDCPWVREHPELYIQGTPEELTDAPNEFFSAPTVRGAKIIAHGRDPYFPPWTDTAQLNYRQPELWFYQERTLMQIAEQCDGVRCDMAMLLLDDVIESTWGRRATQGVAQPMRKSFWPAAVSAVKKDFPSFLFLGEVYWDREWDIQQCGFDYTYDKTLYDRLQHTSAHMVRGHLRADLEFQRRSIRFIENHDEQPAARQFPPGRHEAAAVIAATVPGMAFFHEGQLLGRRHHLPIQLGRRMAEPVDLRAQIFYTKLLGVLRHNLFQTGEWVRLTPRQVAPWESGHERFVAHLWGGKGETLAIAVNFSETPDHCHLPMEELARFGIQVQGRQVTCRDLFSDELYPHEGDNLLAHGLYIKLPGWGFHFLHIT